MITQFHFWHRPHHYDRSCHCLAWFLLHTAPGSIDHDNSISFSMKTCCTISHIWSVIFRWRHVVRFLLSYLIAVTISTRFDHSRQFNIIFIVDHTCMISQVIILFGFHHKWHLIWSVMTTQFCFRCRLHLYNWSRHSPIWFSSQTTLGQVSLDNPASISTWTKPIDWWCCCPI